MCTRRASCSTKCSPDRHRSHRTRRLAGFISTSTLRPSRPARWSRGTRSRRRLSVLCCARSRRLQRQGQTRWRNLPKISQRLCASRLRRLGGFARCAWLAVASSPALAVWPPFCWSWDRPPGASSTRFAGRRSERPARQDLALGGASKRSAGGYVALCELWARAYRALPERSAVDCEQCFLASIVLPERLAVVLTGL